MNIKNVCSMLTLGLSLVKIWYGVKHIFEQGITFTKILVIFINSSQRKPSKWVEVIRLWLMFKRAWIFHYATPFWSDIYVRLCKLLMDAIFLQQWWKASKVYSPPPSLQRNWMELPSCFSTWIWKTWNMLKTSFFSFKNEPTHNEKNH